jgi:hypothetical protein
MSEFVGSGGGNPPQALMASPACGNLQLEGILSLHNFINPVGSLNKNLISALK